MGYASNIWEDRGAWEFWFWCFDTCRVVPPSSNLQHLPVVTPCREVLECLSASGRIDAQLLSDCRYYSLSKSILVYSPALRDLASVLSGLQRVTDRIETNGVILMTIAAYFAFFAQALRCTGSGNLPFSRNRRLPYRVDRCMHGGRQLERQRGRKRDGCSKWTGSGRLSIFRRLWGWGIEAYTFLPMIYTCAWVKDGGYLAR